MGKIGILFGMEQTFPFALLDEIYARKTKGISAELIKVGAFSTASKLDYRVILDRASHEVHFYRSIMKKAYLDGIYVVNNPFNCCVIDNFFNAVIGDMLGIRVPKSAVIPTKEHPPGTSSESMRNLIYPLNWDELFETIGFPAYIKPNMGIAGSSAYKVYNAHEFFAAYDFTGSKVMLLQESIEYDDFFRCFIIGRENIVCLKYNPSKPRHLRYSKEAVKIDEKLKTEMESVCVKISNAIGLEFNAVDFAIRDGVPYAIQFFNPVPRIEQAYMRDEDFNTLVSLTADYLIKLASQRQRKLKNLNWTEIFSEYEPEPEKKKTVKTKGRVGLRK